MSGPRPKTRIFVYGSLQRGQPKNRLLARLAGARRLGKAWVLGRLLDLGEYPGAVVDPAASSRIQGELWEIPYRQGIFRTLDEYEEFLPADPDRSLFIRTKTRVHLADETSPAWIYVVRRPARSARIIAEGAWSP